jgi:hypothetical protein
MNPKFRPGPAFQRLTIVAAFLALIISCSKNKDSAPSSTPQPTGLYSVTGTITNIEAGASGVLITLSNSVNNYTGQASTSGAFSLENVQPGNYTLKIVQEKSNGHVERNVKAAITSGNLVLNLVLPDPVVISSPAHTNHSITVAWTRSTDKGFREYKLYRGYDPGLDETTGDLIYVLTKPTDTIITDGQGMNIMDGLTPNATYFYRVMVMDEYGKIAGSNVIRITTDIFPPAPEMYTLEPVMNFSGDANLGAIHGIAFDGDYLWMEYWDRNSGGYYDTAVITLARYDYKNNRYLKSFTYKGIYPETGGLAFGGGFLWMHVTKPSNIHVLYKIDTTDGRVVSSFNTEYGVYDIRFFKGAVYVNYYYNKIELIDPDNGGLIKTIDYQLYPGTNAYGLEVREGEMWLTHYVLREGFISILNDDGVLKGYVKFPAIDALICFMNNQLVLNDFARIYIYNISGRK